MTEASFTIIASIIEKQRLMDRYMHPENPYNLALAFCLERLLYFLSDAGEEDRRVHVVFESKGKREDRELELEFRRVCSGANLSHRRTLPFEPIFAPKSVNCTGLQIADLVARPIGRHILRPTQANAAYENIKNKIRTRRGRIEGVGLKVFP